MSLNPIVLSIPSCLILIGVELLAQLAGAAGGLAVGNGVAAQRGGTLLTLVALGWFYRLRSMGAAAASAAGAAS